MNSFESSWVIMLAESAKDGLEPFGHTAGEWAEEMQRRGYDLRLHGDVLNGRIVDTLAREVRRTRDEIRAGASP